MPLLAAVSATTHERHRPHCNVMENIYTLFATCSQTAHEAAEKAALLRREFLSTAIASRPGKVSPPSLLSSPQSSYSTVSSAVRKDVGPIFIYNICNCVIREHDFEEALAINPRMVCLFQEQMTRVQNTAVAGADGGGNLGRIWPSGAKKEEGEEEEQKQRNKGKEKAVRSTLGNLFPRK